MPEILEVLKAAVQKGASDVLFIPNDKPMARVHGEVLRMDGAAALTPEECERMVYSLLNEGQKARFEEKHELDCSISISQVGRFRVNVLRQVRGVASVLRVISEKIPTPAEIGLMPSILNLCDLPRGLVLVTGPTGSGKTTTMASLLEVINQKHKKHIVTIEDPIEYLFEPKACVFNQRELGQHTHSFAAALRSALRQNPDVIFIGEMRDLETISLAITAAETGHLCFGTLHTQDAPSTVNRIIDAFPAGQQAEVRLQVSTVLAGVVSQVLMPRKGGGRVCAREVMTMTPAVGSLIRDGKTHQLYQAIEAGSKHGMISLDQYLAFLVKNGQIELHEALAKAHDRQNVTTLVEMGKAPA